MKGISMRVDPIRSAADIDRAVQQAGQDTASQWYVERMARTFGVLDKLPDSWRAEAESISSFRPQDEISDEEKASQAVVDESVDSFVKAVEEYNSGEIELEPLTELVASLVNRASRLDAEEELSAALIAGIDGWVVGSYLTEADGEALTAAAGPIRRVKTAAGEKKYGQPRNSVIVPDAPDAPAAPRARIGGKPDERVKVSGTETGITRAARVVRIGNQGGKNYMDVEGQGTRARVWPNGSPTGGKPSRVESWDQNRYNNSAEGQLSEQILDQAQTVNALTPGTPEHKAADKKLTELKAEHAAVRAANKQNGTDTTVDEHNKSKGSSGSKFRDRQAAKTDTPEPGTKFRDRQAAKASGLKVGDNIVMDGETVRVSNIKRGDGRSQITTTANDGEELTHYIGDDVDIERPAETPAAPSLKRGENISLADAARYAAERRQAAADKAASDANPNKINTSRPGPKGQKRAPETTTSPEAIGDEFRAWLSDNGHDEKRFFNGATQDEFLTEFNYGTNSPESRALDSVVTESKRQAARSRLDAAMGGASTKYPKVSSDNGAASKINYVRPSAKSETSSASKTPASSYKGLSDKDLVAKMKSSYSGRSSEGSDYDDLEEEFYSRGHDVLGTGVNSKSKEFGEWFSANSDKTFDDLKPREQIDYRRRYDLETRGDNPRSMGSTITQRATAMKAPTPADSDEKLANSYGISVDELKKRQEYLDAGGNPKFVSKTTDDLKTDLSKQQKVINDMLSGKAATDIALANKAEIFAEQERRAKAERISKAASPEAKTAAAGFVSDKYKAIGKINLKAKGNDPERFEPKVTLADGTVPAKGTKVVDKYGREGEVIETYQAFTAVRWSDGSKKSVKNETLNSSGQKVEGNNIYGDKGDSGKA